MKMETNLNKGDKLKIGIVLAVGVIVLFGWYVIRPLCISIVDLDDKIYEAEQTKQLYFYKVTNLVSAEAVYKKSLTELLETTAKYNRFKDTSEIDKMATSYVMGYGLFPMNLSISVQNGSVNEAPYKYSKLPKRTAAVSGSDTTTGTNTTTIKGKNGTMVQFKNPESLLSTYTRSRLGETGTTNSEVRCVYVTVVVRGDPVKEQKLIDDLCKKKELRLTGFSWSDTDPIVVKHEDGSYENVDSGEKILRFDVNFYMAEYPEYEKELNGGAGSKSEAAAEG